MVRPLRIEYPNAWYHVMNRGRRGDDIFSDKYDFEMFLGVLRDSSELFGCRVAAFCLMLNTITFCCKLRWGIFPA